jgi:gluconokinase
MRIMAVDVGTSSARALLFDAGGRPEPDASGQVQYEPQTTPDGGVELDADALLDAVAQAIDACLAGHGGAPVDAVGISAFWHGLLPLDGDGRPLSAVITWADTRAAPAAAELRRTLDEREVHARTGTPLHAAYFPAKLRWLRGAEPRVLARARRLGGFAEYLVRRLTGAWRTSVSMASGTGLFAHATGAWDPAMLEVAGIDADQLPPIDDAAIHGLAAPWAARWPALARASWFPAWGDGACSSVGSDCVGPDRIGLNVGTSAALRLVDPSRSDTPAGLWRYRLDAARSLVGGATSEGGNVVAWCRRELALPPDDAALEQAIAALPPDGHGLTALPFLAGERSPGWRDDARGLVGGIRLGTTGPEIVRALMEAVAYRLALIHERLAPLAAPGYALVASGGALRHSGAWTQIVADALGVPLVMSPEKEASSRGAALLALARLGAPIPTATPRGRSVAPDPRRHATYRRALERQRHLYEIVVGPGAT